MASSSGKTGRKPRLVPAHAIDPILPAATDAAILTPEEDPNMDATTETEAMFTDATDRAKDGLAKRQAMFADMGEFGKGNVEALVESSKHSASRLPPSSAPRSRTRRHRRAASRRPGRRPR